MEKVLPVLPVLLLHGQDRCASVKYRHLFNLAIERRIIWVQLIFVMVLL